MVTTQEMKIRPTGTQWLCLQLQRTEYREVLELQRRLVDLKKNGLYQHDVLIIVEHPPVLL